MAEGFQLTSNAAEIIERFRKLPAEVRQGVAVGVKRAFPLMKTAFLQQKTVNYRMGAAGLGGRLTSYVSTDKFAFLDAAIGFRKTSKFPYELSQEFGAKAKPGKAMAIPVTTAARRAGSPRDFPKPLSLIVTMGKAFLVEEGKNVSRLQYVLVKSIKARLRFREIMLSQGDVISREILQGVREATGKAIV